MINFPNRIISYIVFKAHRTKMFVLILPNGGLRFNKSKRSLCSYVKLQDKFMNLISVLKVSQMPERWMMKRLKI